MKKQTFFYIIPIILTCFITNLSADYQPVAIARKDSTIIDGYFSPPQDCSLYPIFLLIHGSQHDTFYPVFRDIQKRVNQLGMGVLTLEKRGYNKEEVNQELYNRTNCRPQRINDHFLLIEEMRKGCFEGWDGRLIILGVSEGGMVATEIMSELPEARVLVLFCCGGGLSPRDEVLLSARKYFENAGMWGYQLEHEVSLLDNYLDTVIENASPEDFFLDFSYKWWSNHLTFPRLLEKMLMIDCPILYFHGTADPVIPIESADILSEEFKKVGKTNFVYQRLEGLDHFMTEEQDRLFEEALKWAVEQLAQPIN